MLPMRFLAILLGLFLYTAYQATRLWPGQWIGSLVLAAIYFVAMLAWQFAYRARPHALDARWFRFAAWGGAFLLGWWATFVLISIPFEVIDLLVSGDFLTPDARWTMVGASAAFTILGFFEVWRGPRVRPVEVSLPRRPASLRGLRIVQISDLHVGPTIRRTYVEKLVAQVNRLDADLIAVTGDLADGAVEALRPHLDPLAGLRSKHGVFFVTGNHEYYWGAEPLLAHLKSWGWIPLLNESRQLDLRGARVQVAGVPDSSAADFIPSHRADLKQALASSGAEDADAVKILLAHRPDVCLEAAPLGVDLQLSGHTHWGQFFPFSLFMPFAHRYYRGLNEHGDLQVYVSAGAGYWGPPNRFGIAPEITLVLLI